MTDLSEMMEWRHDFHAHPELGFDEHRTSARVAALLESFGLEVQCGVGGTGVVGVLQKGNSTRSIGLRADMDALPIHEANGFAHKSQNDGVMHACGHDGHTAMLLGAAKQLAHDGDFNGRVVFLFQPNEEHGEGALAMLKDGVFDRFSVDEVYGMHNIPGMEVGSFATRAGPICASEALFEIEISAQGGHAALPHMGVDAIVVGAEIVSALQTIVSRKLNPSLNGVVSITEFETDGKRNVLPGHAVLRGDARALSPEVNSAIEVRMRQIVAGVCLAHGVAGQVRYDTIFPSVINDVVAAQDGTRAARQVGAVNGSCEPKLFSEDFAHFANAKRGCFMLMGNGVSGSHARPLHSADYDFNDEVLGLGAAFWVKLVEQQLA
ncbi:amidohydrolase [Amylibacter sp. IMCC11727]|uniref:amidohydrolase n=1 Tax=Amylibacter sp. IMCC11727 TaxID=3039851 RepID=UPI00244E2727|nr:amidohydrolase [Amylibacter sp. IMCC11727]WGI21450.1 amidohydrolase [Amylibacter sp. IMCC11727]